MSPDFSRSTPVDAEPSSPNSDCSFPARQTRRGLPAASWNAAATGDRAGRAYPQPLTDGGEGVQSGGRAVDELTVRARARKGALQDELMVIARLSPFSSRKPFNGARSFLRQTSLNETTVLATADERTVGAVAKNKVERADDEDLPARSSPVMTLQPGWSFKRQIPAPRARFLMRSVVNMVRFWRTHLKLLSCVRQKKFKHVIFIHVSRQRHLPSVPLIGWTIRRNFWPTQKLAHASGHTCSNGQGEARGGHATRLPDAVPARENPTGSTPCW